MNSILRRILVTVCLATLAATRCGAVGLVRKAGDSAEVQQLICVLSRAEEFRCRAA